MMVLADRWLGKCDHLLCVQLPQAQLRRQQTIDTGRILQLVSLVVADGSRELLVVRVASPHFRRGILGEFLAGLVPFAQVLDGIGPDLDSNLGEDDSTLERGNTGYGNDRRHALLQALRSLVLRSWRNSELPVSPLSGTIVSNHVRGVCVDGKEQYLLTGEINGRGGRDVGIGRSGRSVRGLGSGSGQGGGAQSQLDKDGESELHVGWFWWRRLCKDEEMSG